MAARLTDKQKKKIIADYVQLGSYNLVAKKNKVADTTVKRIVLSDAEMQKKAEQKKEENTADILEYMDSQKELVCDIIGKGLAELAKPAKLESATMSQITTAIGTLIDKWGLAKSTNVGVQREDDALTKALREEAEKMDHANQ